MIFTEQGLACPDGQDYAALALYMQRTAFDIEAKLIAAQAGFDAFLGRPTDIWQNNSPQPGFVNNNVGFVNFINATNVFRNFIGGSTNDISVPQLNGAFMAGVHIVCNPVGAVNVGTFRDLGIQVNQQDPQTATTVLGTWLTRGWESGTGGEVLTATCVFRQEVTELTDTDIVFLFNHGNTGSTITIGNPAYAWVTYLGSEEQIEVV